MPNHPNPSFETPGALPGEAADWSVVITFNGYTIADFGEAGIPKPVEDFDGASWGTSPYEYVITTGQLLVFDSGVSPTPVSVETFGRWSNNSSYTSIVTTGAEIIFEPIALTNAETFGGDGWGTDAYVTEVSVSAGNAGASFEETFEAPGWGAYTDSVVSGINGEIIYVDGGGIDVEDFEEVEGDLLFFVADPATGICQVPSGVHGKNNGDRVTVLSTGVRPSGLAANAPYFVFVLSAITFRLSKTNGGPAVTFGDLGSGSHYLHADETIFWTTTE